MARNLEARLNSYWPIALAVFRVMFGLLFLCHGLSKLIGWPAADHTAPVGQWPDYYAGWIELVTGVLITAGLFTRAAAFVACGEMAFAYFTVHLPHGFFPIEQRWRARGDVLLCLLPADLRRRQAPMPSMIDRARWPRNRRLLRR